ncbi:MAG: hypothetical protein IJT70_07070 [Clostridia bacterium]|nr:hypothetical protein [Clostridia bacterium]
MVKKIIAGILSAALLVGVIILTVPRLVDDGEDDRPKSVLSVGIDGLSGLPSPFSGTEDGDLDALRMTTPALTCTERNTERSASPSAPCVADSFRVFYTDKDLSPVDSYVDGGCTAAEYTLKDGVIFSDGTYMTADDVLFSVYAALDPMSGRKGEGFSTILGLDDYVYGVEGMSEKMELARKIMASDVGDTPAAGDGYSEEEARSVRECLEEAGAEYTKRICSYILDKYCTEEMVSSCIYPGVTPDEVKESDALSLAYAVRIWNYGTFIYSFEEDAEGDYVGTTDALGNVVCKATYADAMNDENCVDYIIDNENGNYVYDYATASYIENDDEDVFPRYSKVLSYKYIRLTRTGFTGFRDTEGNSYTLEGDSYPTFTDFFKLIKNTYTVDGVFDYTNMEKIESADDYSFSETAAREFALSASDGTEVSSIEGVKLVRKDSGDAEKDTLTIYFKGRDYNKAYNAEFFIVPMACSLKGYDTEGEKLNVIGAPIASERFFEHLKDTVGLVTAGAYYAESYDADEGLLRLRANHYFPSLGDDCVYPTSEYVDLIDMNGRDGAEMLNSKEIAIDLAPVTKDELSRIDDSCEKIYYPNPSYKYILINPVKYKNVNVRAALMSLIDTAPLMTEGRSEISSCIPDYFDSYRPQKNAYPFDESGTTAKELLLDSGYAVRSDGTLIDQATKEKAHFTFCMLPEDEGSETEAMLEKSCEILSSIGAEGEIVFDPDLKSRVYSDDGVAIYVLGWEVGDGLSMFERYALSSGSDAVKASGLEKLYTVGQLDALGKIAYVDSEGKQKNATQSDAVEDLDKAIVSGLSSIDRDERNTMLDISQQIISSLLFEKPLCQYENVCLVRSDVVDVSTLVSDPTYSKGPLSQIWNVATLGDGE